MRLLTAVDSLKEDLPEGIIPIGDDSGDIVLCLGVGDRDKGRVFIHNNGWGWHADAERHLECGESVPNDIRYQTIEEIAPSFEEFICGLKKTDESS